jgi:phosphoribosylamine--glycine ligase
VLLPTLEEMHRQGTPFQGVLYAGLMIDVGEPSVVEFNCRLGDPEAQVVLPLLEGGLTDCLESIASGRGVRPVRSGPAAAVTTVLAAAGYPQAPAKGAAITIPPDLPAGVTVYHAGTRLDDDGALRVDGGRVLTVTGVADRFADAQRLSRDAAEQIGFAGKQFRRDIGWRESDRLSNS